MDKEKMRSTYTVGIRNNEKPFVATWMDLENIILGEVSQEEKEKYHMIPLICVESKLQHKPTYL